MLREELVDLIADSIFRNLKDTQILVSSKDFVHLSEYEKHTFLSMAHNIIAIVDDYYDEELLDDEMEDDIEELDYWEDKEF